MPLIAVTGGIASGKSTISQRFAEHGAVVVDADAVVRELQAPGMPVLRAIAAEFGDDVIDGDGSLRRTELGNRVFGDPAQIAKLNAIVHPAVRTETERRFAAAFEADPDAVVVYDVPLLVEARADDAWDLIIVAHAPAESRITRLIEHRDMSREAAEARVSSQVSDEQRLAIADVVIDTDEALDHTVMEADMVWKDLPALLKQAAERRSA